MEKEVKITNKYFPISCRKLNQEKLNAFDDAGTKKSVKNIKLPTVPILEDKPPKRSLPVAPPEIPVK